MRVTVEAIAGDEVIFSCALGVGIGRWSASSRPPAGGRVYDVELTIARPLVAGVSLFVAEERLPAIHRRDGRVCLIGTVESRDPDGRRRQPGPGRYSPQLAASEPVTATRLEYCQTLAQ